MLQLIIINKENWDNERAKSTGYQSIILRISYTIQYTLGV